MTAATKPRVPKAAAISSQIASASMLLSSAYRRSMHGAALVRTVVFPGRLKTLAKSNPNLAASAVVFRTVVAPPTEATLRRRSQFATEPARCFRRLHGIDKINHALMNLIACRAFECSNVKAGCGTRDPRQHRCSFALRAGWSAKRAHDVVPHIRREHNTLSHR